jgi:hypothetical protein
MMVYSAISDFPDGQGFMVTEAGPSQEQQPA